MKLAALKSKLQVIAGTSIGQVFFDWKTYLNVTRSKTYPCILWSLDNAEFTKDARTATVQKVKEFTITVFAIARFDPNTMDKIDEWDTLEGYFDTYLNSINAEGSLQIMNINSLRGEYVPEGIISADKEIGIMFPDVVIKMFC
jgi:hypothetical protein